MEPNYDCEKKSNGEVVVMRYYVGYVRGCKLSRYVGYYTKG